MAVYLSPGVFPTEIDLSVLPSAVGPLRPAFIGTAKKGPLNEARLISTSQEAINVFGEPFPASYLMYAVLDTLKKAINVTSCVLVLNALTDNRQNCPASASTPVVRGVPVGAAFHSSLGSILVASICERSRLTCRSHSKLPAPTASFTMTPTCRRPQVLPPQR